MQQDGAPRLVCEVVLWVRCEDAGCGGLSFLLAAAASVTGEGCLVKLSARTFGEEGRSWIREYAGLRLGVRERMTLEES